MALEQRQRFCKTCNRAVLAQRQRNTLGCLSSMVFAIMVMVGMIVFPPAAPLLVAGAVIVAILSVLNTLFLFQPAFRCTNCGAKLKGSATVVIVILLLLLAAVIVTGQVILHQRTS